MSNGAAPSGGESRQDDYAAEYIKNALYQDGEVSEPDEAQSGRDYHRLIGLHEATQNHTQWQWWENTKRIAPELACKVGVPPVTMTESHRYVGFEFAWNCHERDEVGDAELFQRLFNRRVLFDHAANSWFFWVGHHWAEDRTQQIRGLVSGQLPDQYYRAIGDAAKLMQATDDEKEKDRFKDQQRMLGKRARALYSIRRINNVLKHLESKLGIIGEEWDQDPWKLGVENGTIDLKTGKLSPGNPLDYIRRAAPVRFEGLDATAPRWEKFIEEIFEDHPDISPFMQRLFGYGITGLSTEHILPILYGEDGRNGKETLLETIGAVLGEIADSGSNDLLIDSGTHSSGQATPHLYNLMGRRIVWVSETRDSARMNTNQVKAITGGGRVVCRPLYGTEIAYQPTHLLLLQTNHKPRIPSGGDSALWERLILIPFNMRFVEHPKAANERERDAQLKQKLTDEGAGILAWLVRGCLQWQQTGLDAPQVVKSATKAYKEDEDDLQKFIDETCLISENASVEASSLYEAFKSWGGTLTQTKFGRDITKRGFEKKRIPTGRYVYIGIGILSTEEEEEHE